MRSLRVDVTMQKLVATFNEYNIDSNDPFIYINIKWNGLTSTKNPNLVMGKSRGNHMSVKMTLRGWYHGNYLIHECYEKIPYHEN